jgi:hypothetical protein
MPPTEPNPLNLNPIENRVTAIRKTRRQKACANLLSQPS